MIKYYVEDGKIKVNKYAVKFESSQSSGKIESKGQVTQYAQTEEEFNALIRELSLNGKDFETETLDVEDILRFEGVEVKNYEEARRLIEPTVEELIGDKIKEIKADCKNTIYGGIDVTLSKGETKHFSLTMEDQINLNGLSAQVSTGNIKINEGVPYHADGEMCTLFSIEDFKLIANEASRFIVEQTTYCNHLMAYVKSLEAREDIESVAYGQGLEGEFLESFNRLMGIKAGE